MLLGPTQGDGAPSMNASFKPPAHEVPSVEGAYLFEVPPGVVVHLGHLKKNVPVERATAEQNNSNDAGRGVSKK